MSSRASRRTGEGGSLPMALLVVIMVGGLVIVLLSRTITAQNQVQFDQTYHGVLPGADAAVELSKFRLNNASQLERDNGDLLSPGEFEVGWTTDTFDGEVDGRTFTWTMTRTGEQEWTVDATAVDPRTDVARRVEAVLREQPLVDVAAFAETIMALAGANSADSYNSATEEWCTGRGWIASNNDVEFSGGGSGPNPQCPRPNPGGMPARTVDRVHLYNWEANEGTVTTPSRPGGDRCNNDQNHGNCVDAGTHAGLEFSEPAIYPQYLDLATDDAVAFIKDALDACGNLDDEVFRVTDDVSDHDVMNAARQLQPAPNAEQAILEGDFALPGGHYCYERLFFDGDIQVSPDASQDNPVIIFVEKDVRLARASGTPRVDVGCPAEGCHRGPHANQTYPEAGSLIIFALEGDITMRNHSQFAGVMYAPQAICRGESSNAQADIYGSIICDDLGNAGGWRFHFDEALINLSSGDYTLAEWRELPSG